MSAIAAQNLPTFYRTPWGRSSPSLQATPRPGKRDARRQFPSKRAVGTLFDGNYIRAPTETHSRGAKGGFVRTRTRLVILRHPGQRGILHRPPGDGALSAPVTGCEWDNSAQDRVASSGLGGRSNRYAGGW